MPSWLEAQMESDGVVVFRGHIWYYKIRESFIDENQAEVVIIQKTGLGFKRLFDEAANVPKEKGEIDDYILHIVANHVMEGLNG